MKTLAAALALTILAGPVSALSCGFGNTAAAWHEADRNEMPFIVVVGTFEMAEAWRLFEEEDYVLAGSFSGYELLSDTQTTPLATDVQIVGSCINGDCGYLRPGEEVITFLFNAPGQNTPITYSAPCSGAPMAPSEDIKAEIFACMTGDPCIEEYGR